MLRSLVRPGLALALAVAGLSLAAAAAHAEAFSFGHGGNGGYGDCGPDGCSPHGINLHGGHGGRHLGYGAYGNPHRVNPHLYQGYGGCRTCSNGDCQYRFYGQPDLFYNYYVPPTCGGMGAELYLSPRPVPPHVGHTYITYQPLMPHEFMYHHHRTYHRYYNSGQGLTRTHVKYGTSIKPNWFW
jgi:hypothetical protein